MAGIEPFHVRFFGLDVLAREAIPLLCAELRSVDLIPMHPTEMGPRIVALGRQLHAGALHCGEELHQGGGTTWVPQPSLELDDSLDLWDEALQETTCKGFTRLVQRAAVQAHAGYAQLGNVGPRIAALRWACCCCWIGSRAGVVAANTISNKPAAISPELSRQATWEAKSEIYGWLRAVTKEPKIVCFYDFDVCGYGVYHQGGKEELIEEAENEWFRRGIEYDIISLCRQALVLPPTEMNSAAPCFNMLQPLGRPERVIQPTEMPITILKLHEWTCEVEKPKNDNLPSKGAVVGNVLFADVPPEPVPDYDDPVIAEKVERGEDLGKFHQAFGLPGSLHGSVGMLVAAELVVQGLENFRPSPKLWEIDGFMDAFFLHAPPIGFLDLSNSPKTITPERLELVQMVTALRHLDLEGCRLGPNHVLAIVELAAHLPYLKFLDLGRNKLDAQAAKHLMSQLAERRIDVEVVRLDGNPLGDPEAFRDSMKDLFSKRANNIVSGGDLTLHTGLDMVRWEAAPMKGTLAARRMAGGKDAVPQIAMSALQRKGNARRRKLDKMMEELVAVEEAAKAAQAQGRLAARFGPPDPNEVNMPEKPRGAGGRTWLAAEYAKVNKITEHPATKIYRKFAPPPAPKPVAAPDLSDSKKASRKSQSRKSTMSPGRMSPGRKSMSPGRMSPGRKSMSPGRSSRRSMSPDGGKRSSRRSQSPDGGSSRRATISPGASPPMSPDGEDRRDERDRNRRRTVSGASSPQMSPGATWQSHRGSDSRGMDDVPASPPMSSGRLGKRASF